MIIRILVVFFLLFFTLCCSQNKDCKDITSVSKNMLKLVCK